MKIGVMFGNPETTTGGNALKFYASVRLEVRKTEMIEKGDADAVGNKVRVKVVKNKVAPPFRKAELDMIYGKGISATGSLLDGAVKYGLIDKKGAWFSYGEEKIGQGRDSAREYLETNPDFAKELEEKLRKQLFPGREFPVPAKPGKGTPPVRGISAGPAAEEGAGEAEAPGEKSAAEVAEKSVPYGEAEKPAEKPVVKEPALEPVPARPAAKEPALEPAAPKPVVEKPAAPKPAAARPPVPPGGPGYGEVSRGRGRPRKNPLPADGAEGLF
jgi:recombination protein RecA